jgi:hypothetical protein
LGYYGNGAILAGNSLYYGGEYKVITRSLFVQQLHDANAITSRVFALGLRDFDDPAGSFMDLGFWDSSVITS